MRRTIATLCLLAAAGMWSACGSDDNTNSGATGNNTNATRNGVVETNANMNKNTNGNSVPSNTAVVVNNNKNDNTAGVKSTNSGNANSGKANANKKP
ncbi:MAG TPA: hypothetical protein VGC66_00885 [Pyrinomonadaceae bacterium]